MFLKQLFFDSCKQGDDWDYDLRTCGQKFSAVKPRNRENYLHGGE